MYMFAKKSQMSSYPIYACMCYHLYIFSWHERDGLCLSCIETLTQVSFALFASSKVLGLSLLHVAFYVSLD